MKKLMVLMMSMLMILGLVACGGGTKEEAKKEYVTEDEMDAFFTNPDDFKGKYVKIPGKILDEVEKDGDITALQAYYDTESYENTYIVHSTTCEEKLKGDDYIMVDGKVTGTFKGENLFGGEITCPLIEEATIEKSSYLDIVVPTIKEVTPEISKEQKGVTITIQKIQYAEKETRVYLEVKNDTKENISYSVYDIKAIQEGKQISGSDNSDTLYNLGMDTIDYEVSAHASVEGMVILKPIDPDKDYQLIVPDIYSDDYETEYKDMKFDIKAE